MFRKISIIGLGLIGGSIALALKQSGQSFEIYGFDVDSKALDHALELGAIDKKFESIEEAVKDADVVFLCSPLSEIVKQIKIVSELVPSGAVITDVGSVKKPVLEASLKIRDGVYFIGGHPMAGSEKKGIEGADPFLFENAVYVLCPRFDVPLSVLNEFIELIRLLGAQIILLEPEFHDKIMSFVSHLPQLLAVALVNLIGEKSDEFKNLAGGGFKDLTRIASSQFEIWRDIISLNREKISEAIDELIERLAMYRNWLSKGEIEKFKNEFENAFFTRNQISSTRKGFIHTLYDVFVLVEDKPGVISKISTALYEAGLDIRDIELLRVREGTGGTFRFSFDTEKDAKKAIEVISKIGYKVFTSV